MYSLLEAAVSVVQGSVTAVQASFLRVLVAGAGDQVAAERAHIVQKGQCGQRADRLAARASAVRFQRMPEATVRIPIRGKGSLHRRSRAGAEQAAEPVPLEHPRGVQAVVLGEAHGLW